MDKHKEIKTAEVAEINRRETQRNKIAENRGGNKKTQSPFAFKVIDTDFNVSRGKGD
ncbi:MAG: hypothetical protein Fur0023_18330 [Bacteroidia bacterium]